MDEDVLICELCRSIPFTDIPSTSNRSILNYGKLDSDPPLNFWAEGSDIEHIDDFGYSYHSRLEDLEASAQTCQLCHIIWVEAKKNLHAFEQCSHLYRQDLRSLEWLEGPLRIVKRIDKGSGFAVVANMSKREGLEQPWVVSLANLCIFVPHGCIYDLPRNFSEQVTFEPYCMSEPVWCYATDAKDFSPRNLSHHALSARGWTYQERMLARRTVFLCKTELKFECGEVFLTEHGCVQFPPDKQLQLNTNQSFTESKLNSVFTQVEAWSDIVANYNGRALTYPADKFPAIAGVATRFQKHVNASYVAGIWSNAILESLLFTGAGGGDFGSEEDFYRAYIAPSWSWAAHYGRQSLVTRNISGLIAKVIDPNVVLRTSNPFGEISDAWLKIQAPLLPLRQSVSLERPTAPLGRPFMNLSVDVEYSVIADSDFVDLRQHRKTNPDADHMTVKLFVLVLCWRKNVPVVRGSSGFPEKDSIVSGIIVTPTGSERTEMHRVGKVMLSGRSLRSWDRLVDSTTFSTVVLV